VARLSQGVYKANTVRYHLQMRYNALAKEVESAGI
jgi:hypothetical protein